MKDRDRRTETQTDGQTDGHTERETDRVQHVTQPPIHGCIT